MRREQFEGVVEIGSLAEEHRSHIESGKLVVLRNNGVDRLIIFLCPCGCNQYTVLQLTGPIIAADNSPRWELTRNKQGEVTLEPSVTVKTCGAHFIVKDNKINWNVRLVRFVGMGR